MIFILIKSLEFNIIKYYGQFSFLMDIHLSAILSLDMQEVLIKNPAILKVSKKNFTFKQFAEYGRRYNKEETVRVI